MKKILMILIFVNFVSLNYAQNNNKINKNNYYDFYKTSYDEKPLTTNWLRIDEIVPIIKVELEKYGFEYNYTYQLYKLSNGQQIILPVYNTKFNFGFLYQETHIANPDKKHRDTKVNKWSYSVYKQDGLSEFIKIDILPSNIYILQENLYWYQYHEDKFEKNDFVNRDVIIEILKEDISEILSKYKDLEKAREENKWKQVKPNIFVSGMQFVDKQARFIDGQEGINQYIRANLVYPEKAKQKKLEGKVVVVYEIDENGKVSDVWIEESSDIIFDDEAMKVIKNMPSWKPAISKGKPIKTKYKISINFKL